MQPTGNQYAVRDVQTGAQQYNISGSISCATAGVCNASGSGTVNVTEGRTYLITWLNTAVGGCDVTLHE
jgi:hypothetical protein